MRFITAILRSLRASGRPPALLILLLPAVSCLPDPLEIDSLPRASEELVVSTQIIPNQSLLVWLTRSFGALEASGESDPRALLDSIAVNDAVVIVDGPTGKDTLEALGDGAYGGDMMPLKAGEVYKLIIKSSSLGEVYATTEVKPKVNFEDVSAELYYSEFGDTLAEITYTFKDAPGKNWYMLNVQEIEEDAVSNLLNPRAFTVLLSDVEFDGRMYGERFRVFPRDYHPGDTVAVSLSNISEEYYRFMKLRLDNRFSFVELVSEPVDYPSNVVGGRGYFNLYVPDVRMFVFE